MQFSTNSIHKTESHTISDTGHLVMYPSFMRADFSDGINFRYKPVATNSIYIIQTYF